MNTGFPMIDLKFTESAQVTVNLAQLNVITSKITDFFSLDKAESFSGSYIKFDQIDNYITGSIINPDPTMSSLL